MKYIAIPKIGTRSKQWLIVNEMGGLLKEITCGRVGAAMEARRMSAIAGANWSATLV